MMGNSHHSGPSGREKGAPRPVVRIRLGAAKTDIPVGVETGETEAVSPVAAPPEARSETAPSTRKVARPHRPWPRGLKVALGLCVLIGGGGAAAAWAWNEWRVIITPDLVEVPGGGGAYDVRVEARRSWVVAGEVPAWVELEPREGRGGGKVRVVVRQNPALQERVAELRVGGKPHRITQEAGEPFMQLSPLKAEMKAEGGKYAVEVRSNQAWRVQALRVASGETWHRVTPESGVEDGRFVVEVLPNTGAVARTVEFVVGGQKHALTQAGVPKPTAEQMLAEIEAARAAGDWVRAMDRAVQLRKELGYDLEKWRRVAAGVVAGMLKAEGTRDWRKPSEMSVERRAGLAALAEQGSAEASLAAAQAQFWYRDWELLECAPVDRPQIAGWLREAARAGLAEAHFHHGEFARSQETDAVQAYRHFYQGHLAKDADATARVAYFLLHGADPGAEEVAARSFGGLWVKRTENGVRLAREAVERGSVRAMYYLGVHEWQQAKTEAQNRDAVARLIRAAEAGHPGAVAELRDSVLALKPELINEATRRRLKL